MGRGTRKIGSGSQTFAWGERDEQGVRSEEFRCKRFGCGLSVWSIVAAAAPGNGLAPLGGAALHGRSQLIIITISA